MGVSQNLSPLEASKRVIDALSADDLVSLSKRVNERFRDAAQITEQIIALLSKLAPDSILNKFGNIDFFNAQIKDQFAELKRLHALISEDLKRNDNKSAILREVEYNQKTKDTIQGKLKDGKQLLNALAQLQDAYASREPSISEYPRKAIYSAQSISLLNKFIKEDWDEFTTGRDLKNNTLPTHDMLAGVAITYQAANFLLSSAVTLKLLAPEVLENSRFGFDIDGLPIPLPLERGFISSIKRKGFFSDPWSYLAFEEERSGHHSKVFGTPNKNASRVANNSSSDGPKEDSLLMGGIRFEEDLGDLKSLYRRFKEFLNGIEGTISDRNFPNNFVATEIDRVLTQGSKEWEIYKSGINSSLPSFLKMLDSYSRYKGSYEEFSQVNQTGVTEENWLALTNIISECIYGVSVNSQSTLGNPKLSSPGMLGRLGPLNQSENQSDGQVGFIRTDTGQNIIKFGESIFPSIFGKFGLSAQYLAPDSIKPELIVPKGANRTPYESRLYDFYIRRLIRELPVVLKDELNLSDDESEKYRKNLREMSSSAIQITNYFYTQKIQPQVRDIVSVLKSDGFSRWQRGQENSNDIESISSLILSGAEKVLNGSATAIKDGGSRLDILTVNFFYQLLRIAKNPSLAVQRVVNEVAVSKTGFFIPTDHQFAQLALLAKTYKLEILEVGAGNGRIASALDRLGVKTVALDNGKQGITTTGYPVVERDALSFIKDTKGSLKDVLPVAFWPFSGKIGDYDFITKIFGELKIRGSRIAAIAPGDGIPIDDIIKNKFPFKVLFLITSDSGVVQMNEYNKPLKKSDIVVFSLE